MAKVSGIIIDETTGKRVAARVQVMDSRGNFVCPVESILKRGPGIPFFYSDGRFEVDVVGGSTRILVERGTEYIPCMKNFSVPASGNCSVDVSLKRWASPGELGWHPGNTHIHYDEKEKNPGARLWLDPRIEDLRMTAVSILKRGDLDYATNKYPVGVLTEFCSAHHYVQCGEERRHNSEPWEIGYGHIMLLNIRNIVAPVSSGLLVDNLSPDYPPLCYACDDARRQGGIVIWCHNGNGMEAPVAAALGKLDAFNLFDPHWIDPEYEIYYRMLNAGFRLPASTGSDWFISSSNRVYVGTEASFSYESWLQGLKQGRTFITNGPVLFLSVDDRPPGSEMQTDVGTSVNIVANWSSHYPVDTVEIVVNGQSVAKEACESGVLEGKVELDLKVEADCWIAARISGNFRDSFFQPIFAHTSPVYVVAGRSSEVRREAASWFDRSIEGSIEWVEKKARFYTNGQRREILDLYREGQDRYRSMMKA